jgi:hypothetical protein
MTVCREQPAISGSVDDEDETISVQAWPPEYEETIALDTEADPKDPHLDHGNR